MSDKRVVRNFVDGERRLDARTAGPADLIDPSTGEVFGTAPVVEPGGRRPGATPRPPRRSRPGATRRRASGRRRCSKIADAIEARADELVAVEAQNTGKPLGLTMSEEIPPMVDQIRFFAGAARVLEGRSAGEYMTGHTSFIRREPIGVFGQVTPWNYPMMMAVWKFAPAIAAGNTVVLKPTDTTPVTTLLMAEIMAEHPAARASSTSSPATATPAARWSSTRLPRWCRSPARCAPAWRSPGGAAKDVKRVHLELGGKAPVVVFDDADIEAAAEAIAVRRLLQRRPGLHGGDPGARRPARLRRLRRGAGRAGARHRHRPAERRGRAVRPGQQRQPARAGQRLHRPAARPRDASTPAVDRVGDAATSTSRPSSPASSRTTR